MIDSSPEEVLEVASQFKLAGEVISVERYGSGHIHETWLSRVEGPAGTTRTVHQRINRSIFTSPEKVMHNIDRVTAHLRGKILRRGGDPLRETLSVVPARDGQLLFTAASGAVWRTYLFIERTLAREIPANRDEAYQIGWGFGHFLSSLADLPGPRLHETIAGFADGSIRVAAFQQALAEARGARERYAGPEITFAQGRVELAGLLTHLLERRVVPERIVHLDTKSNNVLVDEQTGRAVCVIDLDTVMPGTALFDFGDAIRGGACRALEDETDLSAVGIDLELFTGLARGWLDALGDLLLPGESDNLVPAVQAVAFTLGLRFLTDYLAGDKYFPVRYPEQNLVRCRRQFALVREVDRRVADLQRALDRG